MLRLEAFFCGRMSLALRAVLSAFAIPRYQTFSIEDHHMLGVLRHNGACEPSQSVPLTHCSYTSANVNRKIPKSTRLIVRGNALSRLLSPSLRLHINWRSTTIRNQFIYHSDSRSRKS